MQTRTTAANAQQWLRQAQAFQKQYKRGSHRLCAQSHPNEDFLDTLEDDWTDDWTDSDHTDDSRQDPAKTADTTSTSTPDRKPMQALAMPRTKRGKSQAAGQLRSVRLRDGTKAWLPASEVEAATPPPKYTGVGDYEKRVRAAGACCCLNLVLNACRGNKQITQ